MRTCITSSQNACLFLNNKPKCLYTWPSMLYAQHSRQFPWNLTSLLCNCHHEWCDKTSVKKLEQLRMTIFVWFWDENLLINYEYIIEYITWTAYCISKPKQCLFIFWKNIFCNSTYLWNKYRQIFTIQANFQITQVKQDKPASTLLKEGK